MMAWMEGVVGILGLRVTTPMDRMDRILGLLGALGCDVGLSGSRWSGCRVRWIGWDWIAVCQGLRSLISPTAGGFARCLYTFGISSGDEAPCLAPWLHPTPVG